MALSFQTKGSRPLPSNDFVRGVEPPEPETLQQRPSDGQASHTKLPAVWTGDFQLGCLLRPLPLRSCCGLCQEGKDQQHCQLHGAAGLCWASWARRGQQPTAATLRNACCGSSSSSGKRDECHSSETLWQHHWWQQQWEESLKLYILLWETRGITDGGWSQHTSVEWLSGSDTTMPALHRRGRNRSRPCIQAAAVSDIHRKGLSMTGVVARCGSAVSLRTASVSLRLPPGHSPQGLGGTSSTSPGLIERAAAQRSNELGQSYCDTASCFHWGCWPPSCLKQHMMCYSSRRGRLLPVMYRIWRC